MEYFNKRKDLFQKYIVEKKAVTREILDEILFVCSQDTRSSTNYFFPFFRLVISATEINDSNYDYLSQWFNLLKIEELDTSSENYSNLDYYLIQSFKMLRIRKNDATAERFYNYLVEHSNSSFDSYFFVQYNYCRYLYDNDRFDEARKIYLELILKKQEPYLIQLPIKYYDLELKKITIPLILLLSKIDMYNYNRIISYLNKLSFSPNPIYLKENPTKSDVHKLKDIIREILINNSVDFEIKTGKLDHISKGGHGFISCTNKQSYFVAKKYMNHRYKINTKYYFFSYKSYDKVKNIESQAAIIIKEE